MTTTSDDLEIVWVVETPDHERLIHHTRKTAEREAALLNEQGILATVSEAMRRPRKAVMTW